MIIDTQFILRKGQLYTVTFSNTFYKKSRACIKGNRKIYHQSSLWAFLTFASKSCRPSPGVNKHGPYFHFATEYFKCRPLTRYRKCTHHERSPSGRGLNNRKDSSVDRLMIRLDDTGLGCRHSFWIKG